MIFDQNPLLLQQSEEKQNLKQLFLQQILHIYDVFHKKWIDVKIVYYQICPLGDAVVKVQPLRRERGINDQNVYWQSFKPRMTSAKSGLKHHVIYSK